MHPLVCYAASCSLYACVLYIHHRRSLTISTFISSPDDDDDIMITLLLLAMCYPPLNRTQSFGESLTVDEVRRRSGKIRRHALQHPLSRPFWTLFNSKHDDALITLCGFDHASFELLHQLFKPCFYSFTPCRKIRISLLEIQQQRKVGKDTSVPSVVWRFRRSEGPVRSLSGKFLLCCDATTSPSWDPIGW